MEELMILMAGAMAEEKLIEQLEEAIAEYKLTKDSHEVGMCCSLVLTKLTIDSTEGGVMQLIKDFKRTQAGADLLKDIDN